MKTLLRNVLSWMLGIALISSVFGQDDDPLSANSTSSDDKEISRDSNTPSSEDLDRLFGKPESSDDSDDAASEGAASSVDGESPISDDGGLALNTNDKISVDFPNEEIRTVLRNVADLYMLNLVVPETLQGTTSIKLRDVSWRQIFSVVLEPVGYTHVEEGNIIKVVSREALNFEPAVTEIFTLNYATASAVSGTINNLVDPEAGGRVQVDNRTNSLIVSERQSRMNSLREVIGRLDKPTQQVMIETRFIEVSDRDTKNIGLNWASLRGVNFSAGPFQRTYENTSGGTNERTREFENNNEDNFGTSNFDIGGASLTGDPGFSRGVLRDNLTGTTLLDAESDVQTNLLTNAVRNLTSLVGQHDTSRISSASFNASQFGFVLSALKEQADTRLVSHPTVVTLNNQEAEINVGEKFPIPNYTYNEERGTFEVSGFVFEKIGINLKVKPSVNAKGLITMSVTPEVSSRQGETSFGGAGGAAIPIISTRTTNTQVAIQDGHTMGLGGLIETRTVNNYNKVPLLHKIPGLGKAFQHKNEDERQLNLLIFITARILAGEEATFKDVFQQKQLEAAGMDAEALLNR